MTGPIGRRTALKGIGQGLGAVTIGLPLLEEMIGSEGARELTTTIKALIVDMDRIVSCWLSRDNGTARFRSAVGLRDCAISRTMCLLARACGSGDEAPSPARAAEEFGWRMCWP